MKKVLFLLLMVAAFVACSDDDEGIKLDKTKIELLSDGTYPINAVSDNILTYKSENEYVATVSNTGIISAARIGDAKIVVSDGKNEASLTVKVNPKYNTYPDPFIEFGTSKSDIIAKFGTPKTESDNGVGYDNFSNKAPLIMFLFDNNNKLEATGVMVKTSYSSELGSFLGERYAFAGYLQGSYTIAMANGLDEKSVTMGVGAKVYNLSYWLVTYFPYTPTKSMSPTYSFDEVIDSMN